MFIDCDNIRLIEKAYGGNSCEKLAVSYNNENYLLKFPNSLKGKDIRNSALSYSHSPLSEYVGSHIYSFLGFPTHQTFLGTRKNRIVVLCKDFLDETSMLMELKEWFTTDDSSENHDNSFNSTGKQIDIDSLLLHIKRHVGYDYIKEEMASRFWDMFVVDCLIENGDRHNGNWGLLKKGNAPCVLAPVYDNGSAFRITWDDNKIEKYIGGDSNALRELFLVKKTTVFKQHGHSVVPGKLINEMQYEDCNKAVVRIVERFRNNKDRIYAFIDNLPKEINGIPCCSDLRKKWMKTSINFIYENVLSPTYEKIKGGNMAESKDYTMISGFILPKEEMKVESIAKKDGSGSFRTCNFAFMLGGKASGEENVLVNVRTTNDKLIERIEKGEIRAGSNVALSGLWNSYEKDGKTHTSFVANNNSTLTLQASEVRNIKEGQKAAVSGAVVKMGTYKVKIGGKDMKGYSVNLVVDGKAKNDKGEYTESTYINMKTQNQTQVNLIEKYFKAGKRVMVEGEIKKATFKDKTGREKELLYLSSDEGSITLMSSANHIKSIVNGEDKDKSKSAGNESVQKEKESKSIG